MVSFVSFVCLFVGLFACVHDSFVCVVACMVVCLVGCLVAWFGCLFGYVFVRCVFHVVRLIVC